MRYVGHSNVAPRPFVWTKTADERENVTAYDAMYIALAEALNATVVTCDAALAKAPGHRAPIEVVQ